jgi:hypothetical protein
VLGPASVSDIGSVPSAKVGEMAAGRIIPVAPGCPSIVVGGGEVMIACGAGTSRIDAGSGALAASAASDSTLTRFR